MGREMVYVPTSRQKEKPIARLHELDKRKDRFGGYLIVQAITEYFDGEEGKD